MATRHFFAGSNSGQGFYSLFDNIIDPEAKRIYLLKGGPGTGKSSFMRYISEAVGDLGYEQELFFCSSDPGALDAVHFPALGIALIDATAPHTIDADLPGCRDQIVALGDFWDKDLLDQKRHEIVKAGRIKKNHFAAAFRYFAAALEVERNSMSKNQGQGDYEAKLEPILRMIEAVGHSEPGRVRHLFASALTPEGYVSHIQNLVRNLSQRFILQGGPGFGQEEMLAIVAKYGKRAGCAVEAFHYPLDPERLMHVIIPDLDLAVLQETSLENLDEIEGPRIVCGPWDYTSETDYHLWDELLKRGIRSLQEAKSSHIAVEQYYMNAMDFAALTEYRDEILAEILL